MLVRRCFEVGSGGGLKQKVSQNRLELRAIARGLGDGSRLST